MNNVLEVKNLFVNYGEQQILNDVSLHILENESIAVVGASGSGKTTLAYAVLNNIARRGGAIASGEIRFPKENIVGVFQPGKVAFIPQDPNAAWDPLSPVIVAFRELFNAYKIIDGCIDEVSTVNLLLKKVGLYFKHDDLLRYPHEFSGGEKQRLLIALALIGNPYLIVADEPTSALDVTIQADIMALFKQLQQNENVAILFITHMLPLAKYLCERTIVLQAGKIVEHRPTKDIFSKPQHQYTKQLLEASLF